MDCSTLGFPVLHSLSLLKLVSIESVMPSNHLIPGYFFFLSPSIFPSSRVFSSESALHVKWPKYRSISFSISPSNEYSGLISFRIDWFNFLAVQGTLKSLLLHCNLKASVLQCSAFFMAQLSHLYLTIEKTIALTIFKVCIYCILSNCKKKSRGVFTAHSHENLSPGMTSFSFALRSLVSICPRLPLGSWSDPRCCPRCLHFSDLSPFKGTMVGNHLSWFPVVGWQSQCVQQNWKQDVI